MANRMRSLRSGLTNFGSDLLNIETNTILKNGITAEKMPLMPHAILDLIFEYLEFFQSIGADLNPIWNDEESKRPGWIVTLRKPAPPLDASDTVDNGWHTFDRLRWCALSVLINACAVLTDDQSLILERIRRSSDRMKGIISQMHTEGDFWAQFVCQPGDDWKKGKVRGELTAPPEGGPQGSTGDWPLPKTEHMLAIRKMWDVGTEVVVMQTVIQVDGDVMTRIQRSLTRDELERILPLHQQMVETGVRQWQTLFDLLARLIGDLGKAVFDGLGR